MSEQWTVCINNPGTDLAYIFLHVHTLHSGIIKGSLGVGNLWGPLPQNLLKGNNLHTK